VKELNLKPKEAEKLYRIGGDWLMKNLEAVAAFTEGRAETDAALQIAAQAEQEATNQVRQLLGDDGMARYYQCDGSFPARVLVRQFDKQLGFYGMNDEQRARLAEVINAEPYELTRGLVGNFEVRDVIVAGAIDQRFEQTTEVGQRILLKAAEFLTVYQAEQLGHMQAYNLSTQRRLVLRMLRKL
jgi:hypothetical protein